MNDLLNNVKADLLDRRLLPIVAAVVLALLAALGYALFGAGSSTPAASVEPSPVTPATAPLTITPVQNTSVQALAETTSGAAAQRQGVVRNPFSLLPGSIPTTTTSKTATSTTTTTSATTTAKSGGEKSSSSSGSGATSTPSSGSGSTGGSKPSKPKTVYAANVLFGELPAGVTPQNAKLASFPALTKPTPLPNAKEKRIEFVGTTVTKQGNGALFALSGEVILHGSGVCLPSSTQCEILKLQEGKTEQLEYLPVSGPAVTYELRVVEVHQATATASAARRIVSAQSRVARSLFAAWTGPLRYSTLRYSGDSGAFVAGGTTFGAH